jgi:hypothetical protein
MRSDLFARLLFTRRAGAVLALASTIVAGCGANDSHLPEEANEPGRAGQVSAPIDQQGTDKCTSGTAVYGVIRFVSTPTCAGACPNVALDAGHAWLGSIDGFPCGFDPSKTPAEPGTPCGCEYTWVSKDNSFPDVGALDAVHGAYVAPKVLCSGDKLPGESIITDAAGLVSCYTPPEGTVPCGDACAPYKSHQMSATFSGCPSVLPVAPDCPYDIELVHTSNDSVQGVRIKDVDRARGYALLPTIPGGYCFDKVLAGVHIFDAPDASAPAANGP